MQESLRKSKIQITRGVGYILAAAVLLALLTWGGWQLLTRSVETPEPELIRTAHVRSAVQCRGTVANGSGSRCLIRTKNIDGMCRFHHGQAHTAVINLDPVPH